MSAATVEPIDEHTWQLRAVEYDDSGEVSMFECDDCGAVRYA